MKLKRTINIKYQVVLILSLAALTTGCPPTNPGGAQGSKSASTVAAPTVGTTPPSSSSSSSLRMINAVITAAGGGAGAPPTVALFFDSSLANGVTVSNVCTVAGGDKPCVCRFSWTEVNPTTGIGFTRSSETPVTTSQPYTAGCTAPAVWETEIGDGTVVAITLAATTGNATTFSCNSLNYTKQTTVAGGDFRDGEGRTIRNIFHYTCYDYFSKNLTIDHAVGTGTQRPSGGGGSSVAPPSNVPIANNFLAGTNGLSSQSYWYDFYVRSNELGSINGYGNNFICPKVKINKGGALASQFYPLDTTYALANNATSRYTVSVPANIRLNSSGGGGAAEQGVLGYAIRPNTDGTCPAVADSSGLTRRTFRLRRYVVNYPIRYDANAMPLNSGVQPINTIYIMDRPVDRTGQDPLKPFTRLGPKPCPFSFQIGQSGTTSVAATIPAITHSCTVGASKLPYEFHSSVEVAATVSATSQLKPFLYGIPDGKKYGLVGNDAAAPTVRGNTRTYCMGNGTTSGLILTDNQTCLLGTEAACCNAGSTGSNAQSNDFFTPKNLDNTKIAKSECPIYPPPAANLSNNADLVIRPQKGFTPDFLEDTSFKACAYQPSIPVDPEIVTVYNGYTYPQPGDRATDDPKKARAFYCARTYPDPGWHEPPDTGAAPAKIPGMCDSGRPKGASPSNPSKYYVPKTAAIGGAEVPANSSGYIAVDVAADRRTVPDAMITSYAIMNERTYACAFTYNPGSVKKYDSSSKLTDLVTPRSGCCQRATGGSKSTPRSRAGASATAENRGIHSLVDAVGPWYNRYGKPAFNMQSVLLTAAPFLLTPNTGTFNTTNLGCYDTATNSLDATGSCQFANAINNDTVGGHAIVTGGVSSAGWTNENTGTPMGCYDPSEDP